MAGSFGYELDLNRLSEEEKAEVACQVKAYKAHQELIHNGLYYRLSNPWEDNMSAWAFVSQEQTKVLVQGVVFRAAANVLRLRLRLAGLKADAVYRSSQDGQTYKGRALMSGGILLPKLMGDDAAFEICLEEKSFANAKVNFAI